MTLLTGKSGKKPVAIIHNNILVLPDGEVIGIILGHCVFNRNGSVRAKYFTHVLYTLDGRILAKDFEYSTPLTINVKQIQMDAWKIIPAIKDHNCPRIEPLANWSTSSVAGYFAKKDSPRSIRNDDL